MGLGKLANAWQTLLTRRATRVAVAVLALPALVAATPEQEDVPGRDDGTESVVAEIDIDIDVSLENYSEVGTTLDQLRENVSSQLEAFDEAEAAVQEAVDELATIDLAIAESHLLIEELTARSDEVVTSAFINPPSTGAVDLLTTGSVNDLALKKTLLGMLADHDGDVLAALSEARADLEDKLQKQEERQAVASAAHAEAAQALQDLDDAMSQEAQFLVMVEGALQEGVDGGIPEEFQSEAASLTQRLEEIKAATAAERERRRLEERAREAAESGAFVCPVQPTSAVSFTDTWGAARSGGRSHEGTDMMAAHGTATVAPVSGRVVHKTSGLGGYTWYVYGDNGNRYYGAHLQNYENQGIGWAEAGTVIGTVGSSGNASASAPHLHFEIHPGGGSAVNPYATLVPAC